MGLAMAGGMVAGGLLDAAFGDPRRWHPVAGFGHCASALERRLYADSVMAGAGFSAAAVAAPVVVAGLAQRATRGRPLLRAGVVAVATFAVLGGSSLRREARSMAGSLAAGDLTAARARLSSLCARDPSGLDEKGLCRATVESVAENTADAVVAPLFWGAVAGLPGLVGYRAVNTLDAMVGYRSPRYARFGKASARLDDVVNYVPARLTAALTVAAAPVVGGRPAQAWQAWQRYGSRHPSPNAGRCEASAAGALGVRLGGRNIYGGASEDRPELGDGPPPGPVDIGRAARLCAAVGALATGLAAGVAVLANRRDTRQHRDAGSCRDTGSRRGAGGLRCGSAA